MTEDLLAADLQQLIQLFSALPNVRFPDLDASALHDAVAKVKERHLEVLHVEAQLAASRSALEEDQEALLKKGHRLLAYLKVFAEADEALSAQLSGLSLPRLRKPALPRPAATEATVEPGQAPVPEVKKRPRKVQAVTNDGLFSDAPTAG